jgi:thymidylate kinase
MVTMANLFSHWRSLLAHRRDADLLIFDRYALDTAVRLHTWYGDLGSVVFQTWLIRRLSPRPICSYFLDVPAERALARKIDKWELPTLRRQAELYRRECERFGARRLDGERSVHDLAAEISADVLRRITVDGRADVDCR